MKRHATRTALAASALLLTGFLAGCGGDDGGDGSSGGGEVTEAADAPKDASVEDFCGVYGADGATVPTDADGAKEALQIGTPSDMSDDARAGWEKTMSALLLVGEDPSEIDPSDIEIPSTEEATALGAFLAENCVAK